MRQGGSSEWLMQSIGSQKDKQYEHAERTRETLSKAFDSFDPTDI